MLDCIFYTVAQARSVTHAAEQLFLSQPAVSQAIKKLEAEIGGALFVRTTKGTTLTPEGQILFNHVEEAFQAIEAGERHVANMHRLEGGDVRIGTSDTLCRHYMLPTLDTFHRAHPNIHLSVTNQTSLDTVALLLAGEIDFGVVNLPINEDRLVVYEGPSRIAL